MEKLWRTEFHGGKWSCRIAVLQGVKRSAGKCANVLKCNQSVPKASPAPPPHMLYSPATAAHAAPGVPWALPAANGQCAFPGSSRSQHYTPPSKAISPRDRNGCWTHLPIRIVRSSVAWFSVGVHRSVKSPPPSLPPSWASCSSAAGSTNSNEPPTNHGRSAMR